jgi:hypothetical protein
MIWAFSLAIWFVYVWYQSYAMIDSFERERECPKDWFDRVLAYVAIHLSTENWSKLCFSSNVSSKPSFTGGASILVASTFLQL